MTSGVRESAGQPRAPTLLGFGDPILTAANQPRVDLIFFDIVELTSKNILATRRVLLILQNR
jgi:hypothetical protein